MYKKRGVLVFVSLIFLLFSIFVDARIPEQPSGSNVVGNSNALQCSDGTLFGSCNSDGFLCVAGMNLLNEEDITTLRNSAEYFFFGETNCFNPVLKLDGNRIAFTKTGKRIVSQFISRGERKEFILECNGVEEEFNSAYLGEVRDTIRLNKDCQLCNCPEDEAEKLKEYVLVNNLEGVNSLSTESYRNVGRAKIAANTKNLELCRFENSIDSVTCVQQVFDFNCRADLESVSGFDEAFRLADELVNCRQEIITSSSLAVNPNFEKGRDAYRSGDNTLSGSSEYGLRARGSDNARSSIGCDVRERIRFSEGVLPFGWGDEYETYDNIQPYGRIIKPDIFPPDTENILDEYKLGRSGTYMSRNTFSQDLLCGYDDFWYLCNLEGFKIFDNGEMYYCKEGTWIGL